MKLTKLSLTLFCVLAFAGCKSSKPKQEEQPAETAPVVDKAKEAEENKAHAAESYDAAVKSEQAGEYMNARDGYLKAQSYVPDYKDTGARLKNLEEVLVAQQNVEKAQAADPQKADLMVTYAGALRKRGDLDRAMDAAQKAVETNPTLASAHAELASIDFEAGRGKDAADQAQKAIEADPGSADGYYELAFLHRTEQIEGADRAKALEYAQKAAQLARPNDYKTHELLAACYHDSGDVDKALAELKEALRASGGTARFAKKFYEPWGGKPDGAAPDKPADAGADKQPAPEKPADKPADQTPPPAEKPADNGGGSMGGDQPK